MESVPHIVNCGWKVPVDLVDISGLGAMDAVMESKLISLATRVDDFLERVDI